MIYTAFISACLSLFLELCMEEGMIFRRYYLFLSYLWVKSWRKKDRYKRFLLKPLGLCIYCFSSWIYLFISLFYSNLMLVDSIICLGLNYIIIKTWKLFEEVVKKANEAAK